MKGLDLMIFFFLQAEVGIRDDLVTGVQTCALRISCEGFAINTVVKVRTVAASMPEIEEALLVSTAGGDQLTVGVFRALSDNIDHAINSVRSPDRKSVV